MTRSTLVKSALASVALLGFSSAALANGGSYVDSYDSYQPVSEYMPGIYIGFMGGYALNHWDDTEGLDDCLEIKTSTDCGAFAWRPYIGYDFNECFAIEAGYTYIHGMDIKVTNPDGSAVAFDECVKGYAIDVNAKLKIPLDNGFGIYTKLGVVYLNACDAPKVNCETDEISKDDRSTVNVMFGAGISYCFSPNFSADLSWTHYRGDSEWGNCFIPDVDFFALGLMYKFCV